MPRSLSEGEFVPPGTVAAALFSVFAEALVREAGVTFVGAADDRAVTDAEEADEAATALGSGKPAGANCPDGVAGRGRAEVPFWAVPEAEAWVGVEAEGSAIVVAAEAAEVAWAKGIPGPAGGMAGVESVAAAAVAAGVAALAAPCPAPGSRAARGDAVVAVVVPLPAASSVEESRLEAVPPAAAVVALADGKSEVPVPPAPPASVASASPEASEDFWEGGGVAGVAWIWT